MEIIGIIAGSTVLATLLSKLIDLLMNKKNKKSAEIKAIEDRLDVLESADKFLMLGEIRRQGKEFLAQEYITANDLEAFEQTYQLYHRPKEEGGLGGNGFAENIHSKVIALDIHED